MVLGSNNARLLILRIIEFIMTPEFLSAVSWKGTNNKKSIVNDFKNVYNIIINIVNKRYPTCEIRSMVETI